MWSFYHFYGEMYPITVSVFWIFQLISHGDLCVSQTPSLPSSYRLLTASAHFHNSLFSPVAEEHILTLSLNVSVSLPEPAFLPENFKKKDVAEILSHKKAYNACEYEQGYVREDSSRLTHVT